MRASTLPAVLTALAILVESAGCAPLNGALGLSTNTTTTGAGPSTTGTPTTGGSASPDSDAPAPGPRVAEATTPNGRPAWCDVPDINEVDLSDLGSLYTETEPHRALYTLVAATCNPDRDARAQARQIEATRQAWSKKLRLTEADWKAVAEFATAPLQSRINGAISRTKEKLAYSAYSPLDQYETLMRAQDPTYLADVFGARISQAGRLAYITRCLGSVPLAWAMCQADIDAFDADKLAVELRAEQRDGFDRTRISIESYLTGPKLVAHATAVKALVAKDEGYGKMFAIAKATTKDWKVDANLVALADAMDEATETGSRKASDGCTAKTWTAWSAFVGTLPAKQFTGLEKRLGHWFEDQAAQKITSTPNGYLASLALVRCADLTNDLRDLTQFLGAAMSNWPGFRGPRTAVHTAVVAANIALDDRSATIESPQILRFLGEAGDTSRSGTGTLKAVSRADKTVKVTFANIHGMQPKCVRGRYTNRIVQIRSDGTFVYEYICSEERMEAYSEPPAPPQDVDARFAGGLEPGMFVSTIGSLVSVAYRKNNQTPAFVFGVSVK